MQTGFGEGKLRKESQAEICMPAHSCVCRATGTAGTTEDRLGEMNSWFKDNDENDNFAIQTIYDLSI